MRVRVEARAKAVLKNSQESLRIPKDSQRILENSDDYGIWVTTVRNGEHGKLQKAPYGLRYQGADVTLSRMCIVDDNYDIEITWSIVGGVPHKNAIHNVVPSLCCQRHPHPLLLRVQEKRLRLYSMRQSLLRAVTKH